MAVLINEKTKVLVQGITGRDGSFHTQRMLEYGTRIVAGVTPGKGGREVCGVPVFDTVAEAAAAARPDAAVVYVPARFAKEAIWEDINAGIPLIVVITEGLPVQDMLEIKDAVEERSLRLIGPNCPGIIAPERCKIGIMPGHIHRRGGVGVISRSGTLTYEVVAHLTAAGLGQSTCIGLGGDPVIGMRFVDALTLFERDPETNAVVLVGEIGGEDEQAAAAWIARHGTKPVAAFIAGRSAPEGKRMGHAGAIISSADTTADAKIRALKEAGVAVADFPDDIPEILKAAGVPA